MTARVLDGTATARAIREELRPRVAAPGRGCGDAGLGVLLVGIDPASAVYVRSKTRTGDDLGPGTRRCACPATARRTSEVSGRASRPTTRGPEVHGILVQTPLPAAVDTARVLRLVDPAKDVDGFHPGTWASSCRSGRAS